MQQCCAVEQRAYVRARVGVPCVGTVSISENRNILNKLRLEAFAFVTRSARLLREIRKQNCLDCTTSRGETSGSREESFKSLKKSFRITRVDFV